MYLLVFALLDILFCELDNPSNCPPFSKLPGGSENKISLHEMGIVVKHLVPSLYAW